MALTLRLRAATAADLDALAAIEQESFPDPSWTAPDFLRYDCVIAEAKTGPDTSVIAGFLVSRENFKGASGTPPEREILNLAVSKSFRRLGVASALLRNEIQRAADIFLEVRESNAGAIQLYKNAGFTQFSTRRDYYRDPAESAIVMVAKW